MACLLRQHHRIVHTETTNSNRANPCGATDPSFAYTATVLMGAPYGDQSWPTWLWYDHRRPDDNFVGIHIIRSGFFDDGYGTPGSLPKLPLAEIEGVPLLFGKPLVERKGNRLIVHADIIASAYFLLTRYEEWIRRDVRDEHGRFLGKESLPYRAGFLDRPIVDEYTALLRKWAKEIGIDIPTPQRQFSALLTHDVDTLGPPRGPMQAARCIAGGFGRRPFRQALGGAAVALGIKHNPYDNLDEVIQLDRQLTRHFPASRCRSIYFFMAGGHSPYDGAYDVASKRIRNRLRQVAATGAEIGLHASYEAGAKPDRVKVERQTLEKVADVPIEKNRHHFLRWREPEHGEILAKTGIHWDTTLGYADVAGFRLGVCRPISLFDPIRQKPLEIEEHPLIVMDCTLDRPNYMNLDEESAFDYVCRLMDTTSRHRGEFVMLWHNTVLASNDRSYHKRLYPRVLNHLKQLIENDPCNL